MKTKLILLNLIVCLSLSTFSQTNGIVDDFSDPAKSKLIWPVKEDQDVKLTISDGIYTIQSLTGEGNNILTDAPKMSIWDDFTFQATLTQTEGTQNQVFGLYLIGQDGTEAVYLVATNGSYLVNAWKGDDKVVSYQQNKPDWVKTENTIQIEKNGKFINLKINGEQIGNDDLYLSFPIKRIGFKIGGIQTVTVDNVSFIPNKKEKKVIAHEFPIDNISISSDGKYLGSSDQNTVSFWDTESAKPIFTCKGKMPQVSTNGRYATYINDYSTGFIVIELPSCKEILNISCNKEESGLPRFSTNGNQIALPVDKKSILYYDLTKASLTKTIKNPKGKNILINLIDDKYAVTAIAKYGEVEKYMILDPVSNKKIFEIPGTYSMGFGVSPDGKKIITCDAGKSIIIYDIATGVVEKTIDASKTGSGKLFFSSDFSLLGSSKSTGKMISFYNLTNGQLIKTLELETDVYDCVFANDNQSIYVATSNQIKLINIATGETEMMLDRDNK